MAQPAPTCDPPPAPSSAAEPRVLLEKVPWATYVMLRDTVPSPGVRMTYLEGLLEIMSPSRRHEVSKKQIARLVEMYALERGLRLYGYGSTTFREEKLERGLEPDECYCVGEDRDVPDFALEVVVTRGAIDKLEVYRGLGVRELWVHEDGAFQVYELQDGAYERIDASRVLPELDLQMLARYAAMPDQHDAVVALRDELQRAGA